MMTGPVAADNEKLRDLVPREIVVVAPLIALLLVLGVYPKPVLDVINPAVGHTLTTIGQHDPAPRVAEGSPPSDDHPAHRRIRPALADAHRARRRRARRAGRGVPARAPRVTRCS